MKQYILMFGIIVLLIGCTKEVIVVEEVPVYINITINNTQYINITTVMPCNETEINTTVYDRQYVLGLIRQLKHYEKQQDTYFNDSECSWELNQSNIKREKAENALCNNWNSSWC